MQARTNRRAHVGKVRGLIISYPPLCLTKARHLMARWSHCLGLFVNRLGGNYLGWMTNRGRTAAEAFSFMTARSIWRSRRGFPLRSAIRFPRFVVAREYVTVPRVTVLTPSSQRCEDNLLRQ